ncbi:hypothetical protein [Pelagibaculum spongiae]|nr:hypothetical protein [Pelagibaculum spongiae]
MSEEDRKILKALKDTGVASRKVVGRGTMTVDAKDVTSTEAFKAHSKRASEIVRARKAS